MRVVRPQPLTKAAFAPFGEVLETAGAEELVINAGMATRYNDLARVDVAPDTGRPGIAIFRAKPRSLPLDVTMFERHPLASQAFHPLSGRPWLVVVASDDAGRPGEIHAFLASGDQGVNYARSVWHHPLLALEEMSDFLVVDRAGDDNLEEFRLETPVRVEI
ncbi:ureidoglycolate lyase [Jiella avicenniae]|uniref:Ureidoglycolate lyase n=1 Tax=Jiella avicenniae TaxID=2907202 RepID=A0A9X1P3C3_9HYPH|nr:ureidoglycolate lyase [Jiella avicenniae]MCE7028521.1 ureidoglycolate lyase [Jiella avicenniae]